jgi:hypothetical protein
MGAYCKNSKHRIHTQGDYELEHGRGGDRVNLKLKYKYYHSAAGTCTGTGSLSTGTHELELKSRY